MDWSKELAHTIESYAVCLFFVSSPSLASRVCEREVGLAVRNNRHIIPLYLEDVELIPRFEFEIGNLQAIHRPPTTPENLIESLYPHIMDHLGLTSEPKRLRWTTRGRAHAGAQRASHQSLADGNCWGGAEYRGLARVSVCA
jgi:hypothetical protein|tara:strand:- start:471 stop:896 length:426 start_codon:yes stop_codon:yes gene_type:complete